MKADQILNKIQSRKLWVAVFSVLAVNNADANPEAMADGMVEAIQMVVSAGIAMVYIVGQSFVDAKEKGATTDEGDDPSGEVR
jgi:hypothetical protein